MRQTSSALCGCVNRCWPVLLGQVFREAEAVAAAEMREQRGAAAAGADAVEVARVLAAPGDYEARPKRKILSTFKSCWP